MSDTRDALTPAEQMRRIREAVNAAAIGARHDAYAPLSTHFLRLDVLREHLELLEIGKLVRERPFASGVPVIGPVIAGFRSIWNRISTKWYVLPLVSQQNHFNVEATKLLRELLGAVETLAHLQDEMQRHIASLEARVESDSQKGRQ